MISRFSAKQILKSFGDQKILDRISLNFTGGKIHAVVGENGAGKSTLMKILAGALLPEDGLMEWEGQSYAPKNPAQALDRGIAMVYQELSLAPHLSVAENLFLGNERTHWGRISRREQHHITENILRELKHPEILAPMKVSALSPGARQLVEIGRALARDCRMLILDEPTSSLNQNDCRRLFEILRRLRDQGKIVVYISHFLEEIEAIADEVTVLRDGSITLEKHKVDTDRNEMIRCMVGREMQNFFPRRQAPPPKEKPLFTVKDLALTEQGPKNSLEIYPGEILGIFGLVGSGRSEWLRALFGLNEFHSGEISWQNEKFGTDASPSPAAFWSRRVGFVSEDRRNEGLALSMSLMENMALSHLNNYGGLGGIQKKRLEGHGQKIIQQLGIASVGPRQRTETLSGGNQQKVALGRLLDQGSNLWLLDEPTRGIDVAAKADIYRCLIDWLETAPRERAVLMVGSYLPELMGLCDRIAIMNQGRLSNFFPSNRFSDTRWMGMALGEESCDII